MEDNSKWTGPRPPTLAQAEIMDFRADGPLVPKPSRHERFSITREELATLERVAQALKISRQNVGRDLLDHADSAIKVAKRVRGEA